MNTAGMIGRFRGQDRAPTGSGGPEQAFRSAMPNQAFDQDRGSGLDREWARISSGALLIRPARDTDLPEKKGAIIQGYGRHDRPFSRSRPLPQGRAGLSWRSGRPCQVRRLTSIVGAVSTANGHGSAFGALLTGPRPRQGKRGEHQDTAGMSVPFRDQDRSHRAGHARASVLFRGQDRSLRVRHARAGVQVVRDDSGAGSSVVSNRWPPGSADAGPARPGHRPACR